MRYLFLLLFLLTNLCFSQTFSKKTTNSSYQTKKNVALFVINGESNSGGYALNSQAPSNEIGVRNEVKILNNSSFVFEDLNIGVNNLIDHAGLSNGSTHGFELPLANAVRDKSIDFSEVYLVKTGQGGSRIGEWGVSGTYYQKFVQRVDSAKTILKRQGKTPIIFVIYSQGINDALASYSATVWRDSTISHFKRIRQKLGFVPILMTKFMSNYSTYNSQLDLIGTYNDFNIPIYTADATLRDPNHWDYFGFPTIFSRMIIHINRITNEYALSQNTAMYNYLSNNLTSTVTSVSSGGGNSGTVNTAGVVSWTGFVNSLQSNDFLQMNGSTPAGAKSSNTINAQQPFSIIVEYLNLAEADAIVVYFDDVETDTYGWVQGKTFVAGIYQYSGGLFAPIGGYAATAAGSVTAGDKIKIEKNGNNLIYSRSINSGAYEVITTATNALVGKSTMYLKALFAIQGSYKIKVSITN